MIRLIVSCIAVALLVAQPAFADERKDGDFAEYAVVLGASPFGGSLAFAYNSSWKTTWQFAIGGVTGLELDLEIEGNDYTVKGASSWVGCFVNHRPFEGANWFRLVAGIGIGTIENELTDSSDNEYHAHYKENPVGYLGVGFGARPEKGFLWGVDIGWLQTPGPHVHQVAGDPNPAAVEDIEGDLLFGNVLPNVQVTLGWGF